MRDRLAHRPTAPAWRLARVSALPADRSGRVRHELSIDAGSDGRIAAELSFNPGLGSFAVVTAPVIKDVTARRTMGNAVLRLVQADRPDLVATQRPDGIWAFGAAPTPPPAPLRTAPMPRKPGRTTSSFAAMLRAGEAQHQADLAAQASHDQLDHAFAVHRARQAAKRDVSLAAGWDDVMAGVALRTDDLVPPGRRRRRPLRERMGPKKKDDENGAGKDDENGPGKGDDVDPGPNSTVQGWDQIMAQAAAPTNTPGRTLASAAGEAMSRVWRAMFPTDRKG